jgi:hypothetical protein
VIAAVHQPSTDTVQHDAITRELFKAVNWQLRRNELRVARTAAAAAAVTNMYSCMQLQSTLYAYALLHSTNVIHNTTTGKNTQVNQ